MIVNDLPCFDVSSCRNRGRVYDEVYNSLYCTTVGNPNEETVFNHLSFPYLGSLCTSGSREVRTVVGQGTLLPLSWHGVHVSYSLVGRRLFY